MESSDLVVCDRSAIDPIVYAILTSTSAHEALARKEKLVGHEAFQVALARYREAQSIVVLLGPVKDWVVDDGIRSTEQQEECMGVFQRLLEELGIPYRLLGADRRSLFDRVVSVMGFGRL